MGYLLSSLTNPSETPRILGEYCIYLIHEYELTGIARSLSTDFREYSTRLGSRASIFAASDQREYNESFAKLINDDPWFKMILGNYYDLSPGIIISKPGLPQFKADPGDVFIYVSDVVINLAYYTPHVLSQDLVDLCRHDYRRFITNILRYSRSAIAKSGPQTNRILHTLRDAVMIEPNINGIGIKSKPILRLINSVIHNQETEKAKYDCVVYQF